MIIMILALAQCPLKVAEILRLKASRIEAQDDQVNLNAIFLLIMTSFVIFYILYVIILGSCKHFVLKIDNNY